MKICPNCKKKMNNRSKYCRICGSKLNGDTVGDFKTEIINLFKDHNGYFYIFTVSGNQLILRDENIEILKMKVLSKNYPWIESKGFSKKNNSVKTNPTTEDNIVKKESPVLNKYVACKNKNKFVKFQWINKPDTFESSYSHSGMIIDERVRNLKKQIIK